MVWRDGIVPEGSPSFSDSLTAELLDFGYGVLALGLELRDANATSTSATDFRTNDAFEFGAEALESAARRGKLSDQDQGRHLVVSAAAFHLAGFAARSYSLLPISTLAMNLASCERGLAHLLRRDFVALRELIVGWLSRESHSDEGVARRLNDEKDAFGPEDAVVLALTTVYFRALGLADSALLTGDRTRYEAAITALRELIAATEKVGNLPLWWVTSLTVHLLFDLWGQSLHTLLPEGPRDDLPDSWSALRRNFITQLAVRRPPQIDLWPSQLEAARRSVDPRDDLVVALPTSAGKTRIAELCILRALAGGGRVIYVTPLRALSAQVERVLARTFVPLGAAVSSLYGPIGASTVDAQSLSSANIVVATPEKIDFVIRQDPQVLDDVALVVLDEGHMIGLGSREIRYEVLIQRLLRRADSGGRRIVCLSAMFNPKDDLFKDFAAWLRSDESGSAVHVEWRPTRQRLAQLDWSNSSDAGRLSFLDDEAPFVLRFLTAQEPRKQRKKQFPASEVEFCVAAANAFARDGHAVLVYSPQRSQIPPLVRAFNQLKKQGYIDDIKAPDPAEIATALAIGREWLGEAHPVVEALRIGVGTHHGALPRPFQSAVEELLERKRLPIVVASPTLAQGVDLSCSVLLFRALTRFDPATGKPGLIRPVEFANVVGRAGRAYVDLDGIVVLPSFESGWAMNARHEQFSALIRASRGQRLVSGIAHLVYELAERLCSRLGVRRDDFLEYVLNNSSLWTAPELAAAEALDEEDEGTRSLEEYIADLDVAILSLIEQHDASVGQLAELLDDILRKSLWKRTLEHLDEADRASQRALIVSRAKWLWSVTTGGERRACFASGLGERAGTFIYRGLSEFVAVLAELQLAVVGGQVDQVCALAVRFAELVAKEPFFFARKAPKEWQQLLSDWVRGIAFADLLRGLGIREQESTQSFVQDGVVFRLVWAAEAVRVQALASGHSQAKDLGDGPMLVLTHGVPSIPAALLCQAGYSSRVGAKWLTSTLESSFRDFNAMRRWMDENEGLLAEEAFWERDDERVLWNKMLRPTRGEWPRVWNRRPFMLAPTWFGVPPSPGTLVRLFPGSDRIAIVCGSDLTTLGQVTLPFNPESAALDAVASADAQILVTYFGPN